LSKKYLQAPIFIFSFHQPIFFTIRPKAYIYLNPILGQYIARTLWGTTDVPETLIPSSPQLQRAEGAFIALNTCGAGWLCVNNLQAPYFFISSTYILYDSTQG
jgi:hypothetical protein